MAGHVFISYSRSDAPYVQRLVRHLLGAGAPVWVDHSLHHRRRWAARARAALQQCAAVVVVVSSDAEGADWVRKEIRLARKLGKPVMPLLLQGQLWSALGNVPHQDVRDSAMPPPEWVHHVLALTGRRPRPTPPPRSPSPNRPPSPTGRRATSVTPTAPTGTAGAGPGHGVDLAFGRATDRAQRPQRQLLTALRAVLGRASPRSTGEPTSRSTDAG